LLRVLAVLGLYATSSLFVVIIIIIIIQTEYLSVTDSQKERATDKKNCF